MAKSQNWGTVKMHDVCPERTQQYAVFNNIKQQQQQQQQQSPVTFYNNNDQYFTVTVARNPK